MLQVTSSDFDAAEGTLKKVLRRGLLIEIGIGIWKEEQNRNNHKTGVTK
jgi:hypothetical protein